MFTTAGEATLITGASDGNATLAAVTAAKWSVRGIMKAMKSGLAAQVFTNGAPAFLLRWPGYPGVAWGELPLSPWAARKAAALRRDTGLCADPDGRLQCYLAAEGWSSNPTKAKQWQEQ
jgi:hypothetical protein